MNKSCETRTCSFEIAPMLLKLKGAIDYDLHTAATRSYCGSPQTLKRFSVSQRASLLKKLPGGAGLRTKTLAKFAANMVRMTHVNESWASVDPDIRLFRRRVRSLIEHVLSDFSWEEVFEQARLGPGTSLGTTYQFSNLENKWTYPLTVTPLALGVMDAYFRWDSQLDESVEAYNRESTAPRYRVVRSNRVTTVAKTCEIERVIAIEPTCNMYLQQGLMGVIADRLLPFGLDLAVQPERHRLWTFVASVSKKLATIDFSMASDSLSLAMIKAFLPPSWYAAISRLRTPFGSCALQGREAREFAWPIISSMGNAVTFPLETLVFWAMAKVASTKYRGDSIIPDLRADDIVSAFGDDVILPTKCAPYFIRCCEACGLTINKEKSFYSPDESFRESCGVDVLDYRNIRGFYVKSLPLSAKRTDVAAWLCGLINRFIPIGKSFLGDLRLAYGSATLKCLFGALSSLGMAIPVVPSDLPDEAGLRLFYSPLLRRLAEDCGVQLRYPARDEHGTYSYRFFVSKFSSKGAERSDTLQYAVSLKHSSYPERPRLYVNKTGQRYVVAKGLHATCAPWLD